MFELHKDEKIIVDLVRDKLKNYSVNNKEFIKKENELFHLTCYLKEKDELELLKYISPNEPGDFIIEKNNKKIVIEVAECFGNISTYKSIKKKLNSIFQRVNTINDDEYKFTNEECKKKFNLIFFNKNKDKVYLDSELYDKKILLIITGEYYNCPVTGSWFEKFLNIDVFDCNRFDDIWILNYFSSGKDNGPTIFSNVINNVIDYQNMYN